MNTRGFSTNSAHSQPSSRSTALVVLPRHRIPVIFKSPALLALGVYLTGGSTTARPVLTAMVLLSLLWAVLYSLNEWSDVRSEQNIRVPEWELAALLLICTLLCKAAGEISWKLGTLFLLMTICQCCYSLYPFRFKRFWQYGFVLSGIINPLLRLWCGVIFGWHALPALVLITFILLHTGAVLRARCLLRQRDQQLGYLYIPDRAEAAGIAFTILGLAGAFAICFTGLVPAVFILMPAGASFFSWHAWSHPHPSLAQLRRSWMLFAWMALAGITALLLQKHHGLSAQSSSGTNKPSLRISSPSNHISPPPYSGR